MNNARRRAQLDAGRHVPDARRVPVVLSDALYAKLMAVAGGTQVAARLVLEAALERAMRAEFNARDATHRAEVSRQRRRFGWRW